MSFTQCTLRCGEQEQTSWIPSQYAVQGDTLRLRDQSGEWINGWLVVAVFGTREKAPDYRQLIRRHRHGTGDDLPTMD